MKRIFVLTLFFLISLSNFNLAYSISPDVFIQSTVNRASQVLSENISKEETIESEVKSEGPVESEVKEETKETKNN